MQVSDNTFALCREAQTVLVNVSGKTERNKALKWSDVPVIVAFDEPYFLGILNDCVEASLNTFSVLLYWKKLLLTEEI